VLPFLDPRSESPLESGSRAVMHVRQVPTPDVQVELVGASGRVYRVDFYWKAQRLIGEADGASKYADAAVLMEEKLREDDLREAGHNFVRWTYGQIFGQQDATVARILRKLNG
jgi:hypothetical protein